MLFFLSQGAPQGSQVLLSWVSKRETGSALRDRGTGPEVESEEDPSFQSNDFDGGYEDEEEEEERALEEEEGV